MKKSLVVLFSLGVVILGSVIAAQAEDAYRLVVNVPFQFHAGNVVLPAGEYVFEMSRINSFAATGSAVTISTRDRSIAHFMPSMTRGEARTAPAFTVTFNRYGSTYFLCKVQNGSLETNLPITKAEKELAISALQASGGSSSKVVTVVSSN
jgi:hypothetical protein